MNAFHIPPKATPAPSKQPKRTVRGLVFERTTQSMFSTVTQPPHFRIGQHAQPPVDQIQIDTLRALRNARNERSEPKSAKVAV